MAVLSAAILLVAAVSATDAGATEPPSPASSADYFGTEWNDPMDFSNIEDFDVTPGVMIHDGDGVMSGGRLNVRGRSGQSYFYLVKSVGELYPTSATRDSDMRPLDASVYRRISLRMHSQHAGVGGISYQTCEDNPPGCTRTKYFNLKLGWHTYDLDMTGTNEADPYTTPAFTNGPPWSGQVHSIILTPSVNQSYTPDVTLDWVRIYRPISPPRTNEPPIPQVIDPDERGGDDWASTVLGDPWDFNQPSDVWISDNTNLSFSGGQVRGSSAGNFQDPLIIMNTGGRTIDATKYTKASVTVRYDGPWGLQDFGGGMVARFVWQLPGWDTYQVGDAFLVTTARRTYTMDLKTDPPTAVLEPGNSPTPVGWGSGAASQVSLFRFDPHEDSSPRNWHIEEIRLARNDRVNPRFTIRYLDQAWEPGTTAEIYADTDRNTANGLGTRIASGLVVTPGENQFVWDGRGVGVGSYWIHVVMTDPSGNVAGSYATGQLDVDGPPPVNPFGSLDAASAGVGSVSVAGWAIDPDTTAPIDVHVYVGAQGFNLGPAALYRGDLAPFDAGTSHGFDTTLRGIAPGVHNVCAYGVNVGPGGNSQLGCRTVVVPSNDPFGSLDLADSPNPGTVRVAGWAIDPNTTGPIGVHVYIGATGHNLGLVAGRRQDLAGFGYGTDHAFDRIIGGVPPGTHQVCAYGVNVGPGSNHGLGCRSVIVK